MYNQWLPITPYGHHCVVTNSSPLRNIMINSNTSGSRHYGPAPSLAYGIHQDIKTSRHQDIKTSRHQDIKTSRHQDVYHRPNLERARNVGSRLLSIITVVMYCTVLYCTVLYCTGPYIAIHSHDVYM